ncbi:hypothetical protein FGO68_gene1527 [Halteria grandinella]|uniref:Uncharacterized protein n=1 Tax=Halteria grandinella TaxID=5974 RepID=A0A8J8SVI5_HALGN|nr:hypothetical protein FGO68_gene1527 [Halteria grandinella]
MSDMGCVVWYKCENVSCKFDLLLQLSRQSARLLTERSLVRTQPGAVFFYIIQIAYATQVKIMRDNVQYDKL